LRGMKSGTQAHCRSAIPPLGPVRAQGSCEEFVVQDVEYPEGVGEATAVLRLQGDGQAEQPVVKMAHQAGLEVQGDPDLIFSHHAGRTQLAAPNVTALDAA